MSNHNLETFIALDEMQVPVINLIADGAGTVNGAEIDTKDIDGVVWVVRVTDINTTGTLQFYVEDSATSGSGYATLTDVEGNDVDTGVAAITADGTYVARITSEMANRYVRLVCVVATAGIDFDMVAIPFGRTYNAPLASTVLLAKAP